MATGLTGALFNPSSAVGLLLRSLCIMAASLADFETLKWQLEDTEGSLAAALARIEAFRIHEKMLCQELAQLRLGQQPAQEQQQQAGSDGAASSMQHQPNAQQLNALGGGTQACQQSTVPAASQARAPSGNTAPMPAYITDISGHVPVMIVSGGRKVHAAGVSVLKCCLPCKNLQDSRLTRHFTALSARDSCTWYLDFSGTWLMPTRCAS